MSWIKSSFIGNDATIISLLSRTQLYPQQSPQESIEVTQVHIHIVKVLIRCVMLLEAHDDYDSKRMESLLKILMACLEKIDLKNFHMLGKFYWNTLLSYSYKTYASDTIPLHILYTFPQIYFSFIQSHLTILSFLIQVFSG